MTKRKRVEAWAWTNQAGVIAHGVHAHGIYPSIDLAHRSAPFMHLSNGYRLVHLVEHTPAEARELRDLRAVARAAWELITTPRTWARSDCPTGAAAAIARLKRPR